MRTQIADRFAVLAGPRPADPNACWEFQGYVGPHGYGYMQIGRRAPSGFSAPYPAHRVSYEIHVGEIPEGLQLDHLCRNRRCVNPSHLEPVTGKENMVRAFTVTCRKGHERNETNTYIDPSGYRRCRDCRKARG